MGYKRIIINELSKIDKALDLAYDVHANQYRKSSKKPYIVHPFRVYQRAKSLGLSINSQIIALLHDVYEDANNRNYVIDKIQSIFGSEILNYIKLLSHEKNTNYNEYLLYIAQKSKTAFEVKLLDMIDNLLDSPTSSQKEKYRNAILYLLNKKINIDGRILNILKKILKI